MDIEIADANQWDWRPTLFECFTKIKDMWRTAREIAEYLETSVGKATFGAWVASMGREPVGAVCCELCFDDRQQAFCGVAFAWIKGGVDIGRKLMDRVEDWARRRNIATLKMYTRRNPEAWQRRYGFTVENILMTREID